MIGWTLFLIMVAVLVYLATSNRLAGYRTKIFGWLTVSIGSVIPLLTQITDYLQTLDWRQYLLTWDKGNLAVLAVVGGLGIMAIILRYKTNAVYPKDEE